MNIKKISEVQHFLISRSGNVTENDMIPVPTGRTREETKRLIMEEHARAVAEHQTTLVSVELLHYN